MTDARQVSLLTHAENEMQGPTPFSTALPIPPGIIDDEWHTLEIKHQGGECHEYHLDGEFVTMLIGPP